MIEPLRIARKTLVEEVYDRLYEMTTGPGMKVGDRLQSVRKLATLFGTSVPTVLHALDRLAAEGLVERRPGSGIYVANREIPPDQAVSSIVLCVDTERGASQELIPALLCELHGHGHTATVIESSHSEAVSLLRSRSQSADCLLVQGSPGFPFQDLAAAEFRRRPMIGVMDWETDLEFPNLVQVISDGAAGGRLVCDHLRDLGHEHVLIVGPAAQIDVLNQEQGRLTRVQQAFTDGWAHKGGTWEALGSGLDGSLDDTAIAGAFSHPEPPTAIFGLRDMEANQAQRILQQRLPQIAKHTAVVGYGDTAWSCASTPAITTINLDLDKLAGEIANILGRILAGKAVKGRVVKVKPKLVERETSTRRGVW